MGRFRVSPARTAGLGRAWARQIVDHECCTRFFRVVHRPARAAAAGPRDRSLADGRLPADATRDACPLPGILTSELSQSRLTARRGATESRRFLRLTPPAGGRFTFPRPRKRLHAAAGCCRTVACVWNRTHVPIASATAASAAVSDAGFFVYIYARRPNSPTSSITPHSIRKSRTGPILSRLISRSGLELVNGPDVRAERQQLAAAYAARPPSPGKTPTPGTVPRRNAHPTSTSSGTSPPTPRAARASAACCSCSAGSDAVARIMNTVGHIVHEPHQRRDDPRHLRRLHHRCRGRSDLLRARRPRGTHPGGGRERPETLGAPTPIADGGLLEDVIPFPGRRERWKKPWSSSSPITSASPTRGPVASSICSRARA